jgi:hemerythrin
MNAFEWDDCFRTGLDHVDDQHQELVNIMNRFGELLMKPGGRKQDEVERVFAELADYSKFHFKEEAAMMLAAGLDGRHIQHHCAAHNKFLEDVTQMHEARNRADRESARKLLSFLTNWLAYHILGTDQEMARLMRAIKKGKSQRDAYLAEQHGKDPATIMLLRAMTTLFNQVSDQNRTLLELNQSLEARIASRTSELVDMNHQLEDMAMTDVLTGLPNRRHAMKSLAQYWQKSISTGIPLACMMIDADGFKQVNDSYGHEAGDEVLRQLARCLRNSVRNDDVVCRLGGDEFLIICDHTTLAGAMTTAEKLRREVSEMVVPVGSGGWKGSVSVGVAERTQSMQALDELLKLADDSVYSAKRRGRNCVESMQAK